METTTEAPAFDPVFQEVAENAIRNLVGIIESQPDESFEDILAYRWAVFICYQECRRLGAGDLANRILRSMLGPPEARPALPAAAA